MSGLKVTHEELYKKVSYFLGWGEDPVDKRLRTVKEIVQRAYRNYLYPVDQRSGDLHSWSFLKPLHSLTITPTNWKYVLPENFGSMASHPIYGDDDNYSTLRKVSPEQILEMRSGGVETSSPMYYALNVMSYDEAVGTRYEMWLYPSPGQSYGLRFFYKVDPDAPSTTGALLVGGVKGIEALIESCLAVAETQEDGKFGVHFNLAKSLIQELIRIDGGNDNNLIIGSLITGTYAGGGIGEPGETSFSLKNLYPDNEIDYSD